jgi:hypothetical protein
VRAEALIAAIVAEASAPSEALFTTPTSLLFTPPPKLRTLDIATGSQHLELLVVLPIMRQLARYRWESSMWTR